ncbi:MAG: hypothetical protein U0235_30270 [Polyangiaceae bacterium]
MPTVKPDTNIGWVRVHAVPRFTEAGHAQVDASIGGLASASADASGDDVSAAAASGDAPTSLFVDASWLVVGSSDPPVVPVSPGPPHAAGKPIPSSTRPNVRPKRARMWSRASQAPYRRRLHSMCRLRDSDAFRQWAKARACRAA